MDALIVYGSPQCRDSASYRLGSSFAKGLGETGWGVEEVVVYERDIRHCLGCKACWTATPGECVQHDDMAEVLARQRKAALLVLAMPLYFFTMPGKVKDYVDRQLPLFEGWFRKAIGKLPADARVWPDGVKVVLISPCGFPGTSNFDALTRTLRMIYGPSYCVELLVPFAGAVSADHDGMACAALYDLMRDIGREFGATGAVSAENRSRLETATAPDPAKTSRIRARLGDRPA